MVGRRSKLDVMASGSYQPNERGSLLSNNHVADYGHSRGQVQNVKNARVYVFGDADVADEELEDTIFEMGELRSRNRSKNSKTDKEKRTYNDVNEETYFDREIQEGDTLQSIALKYACPVAELKRINNLIRDQEFYALKSIKIPMKRFGLLTELLEKEKQQLHSSKIPSRGATNQETILHVTEANEMDSDNDSETQELIVRTLSIRGAMSHQGKEAEEFLKRMDTDIHEILSSTKNKKDTLEEVTASLTCKRIHPLKKNILDGADCGIQLKSICVTLILVTLVAPLLYFLYFEYMKPQTSSSNANSSTPYPT